MWLDINKSLSCSVALNTGIGQRQFSVNSKEKLKNKSNRKTKSVPNINRLLLRVACTIPVSSADNERANGTGLKACQRTCSDPIVTESLSGLALYLQGSKCV